MHGVAIGLNRGNYCGAMLILDFARGADARGAVANELVVKRAAVFDTDGHVTHTVAMLGMMCSYVHVVGIEWWCEGEAHCALLSCVRVCVFACAGGCVSVRMCLRECTSRHVYVSPVVSLPCEICEYAGGYKCKARRAPVQRASLSHDCRSRGPCKQQAQSPGVQWTMLPSAWHCRPRTQDGETPGIHSPALHLARSWSPACVEQYRSTSTTITQMCIQYAPAMWHAMRQVVEYAHTLYVPRQLRLTCAARRVAPPQPTARKGKDAIEKNAQMQAAGDFDHWVWAPAQTREHPPIVPPGLPAPATKSPSCVRSTSWHPFRTRYLSALMKTSAPRPRTRIVVNLNLF